MEIKELQYAFNDKNDIIFIDDAKKGVEYYLFKNKEIELILADGEINVKHWRRKTKDFVNYKGESIQHLNAKRKILKDGFFIFKGFKIIPYKIKLEYYIKEIGMQPDVVFLNKDNSILCIIEIHVTNKKSKEDIDKLNKLNTFVYEYNYNKQTTERISRSIRIDAIKEEIKKTTKMASDFKREMEELEYEQAWGRGTENKIEEVTDRIDKIRESITACKYSKERINIQTRTRKREINEVKTEINEIERRIKHSKQDFIEIASNCEKEWFASEWRCKSKMNKLDFIKYELS